MFLRGDISIFSPGRFSEIVAILTAPAAVLLTFNHSIAHTIQLHIYEVSCRTNRTALISGGRFECEVA
jgi:hypothetical protein